jgi:hypothetical protein
MQTVKSEQLVMAQRHWRGLFLHAKIADQHREELTGS